MQNTPEIGESEIAASNGEATPAALPTPSVSPEIAFRDWPDICSGIALAGGVYPFCLLGVAVVVIFVATIWNLLVYGRFEPDIAELIAGGFGIGMAACVGSVIGILHAGFVTIVTLPFVYLLMRTLKLRCELVMFGAVWGGVVGFTSIVPISFNLAADSSNVDNFLIGVLLPLALGPGVTTILGQIGGAWGGARARRRSEDNYQRELKRAYWPGQRPLAPPEERGFVVADVPAATASAPPAETAAKPAFQFSIRHILWIMFWFSLLLSVMRLAGIQMEYTVPLVLVWLAYQAGTLYLVMRLAKWWAARKPKPRVALAGRLL